MNKVTLSDDTTTLEVWTKDADSVYQLIGEAEDDGLKLNVESKRSWFSTKLTARIDDPAEDVSTASLFRFESLVRRIRHLGLPEAA